MYAKKKITINFTLNTKHVRFYLPVPISAFLTLTPNIPILFIAIPQHIIISLIHCTWQSGLLKTLHNHFW